ncbi:MAG: sigma-54-dependent Fis family transcriptional regulator [Candidatus Rokubacteria bacterium]|nr:sigma-54-dependent Fis family transcriptional regulator [Candidatus Rokubacteria bacterium]
MAHRILVADDTEASREGLKTLLEGWGYEVETAADGHAALEAASGFRPAVLITDLVMPGLDGLGLLKALRDELPHVVVILLTGHGTVESAVAAMKEGAYDYLTKPVDAARLRILIEKALEQADALREVVLLRRRVKNVWGYGQLVGNGAAIQEVFRLIELAAPTTAPVLITGESGTGKELVARTLHDRSPRRRFPFVPVNCAAIPETLLESEIFGHEKGAFTGALERRTGCFELANGGTLFLDEIAEMSSATQAKFLRILQDGVVRRLGGQVEIKVDVRIVAATNKEPTKAIKDGALREDLYYRLNVFSLALPPLRGRREDIPLLIESFIEEFNTKHGRRVKSVDEAGLRALLEHPWPGNVRELRNTLERAVIVCDADLVETRHLPLAAAGVTRGDDAAGITLPLGIKLEEAEHNIILKTLASVNNNKTRAAALLGISPKTLHNKLRRYGV